MKGISTNPEQVAVWIESLGVCSHISMAIDDMYTQSLYNINNGQVASASDGNIQDAVKIRKEMHTAFLSSLPYGFHKPIKRTVKTMQVLKITHKPVYDLEAVFARLLVVGQKRNIDLVSVFQHELSPVSPSLMEEVRPSIPSRHQGSEPPPPDTLLVDASQLLYHVV